MSVLRRAVIPAILLAFVCQALGGVPAMAAEATRILIVGDSITQGSSGDYTWRYQLWKHLQASAPGATDFVGERTWLYDNIANTQNSTAYANPNFDRDHHAKWGQQLQLEKDEIAPAVSAAKPDVMLLLMGINDLTWGGESPATAFGNLQALLRTAHGLRPSLRVVVGHTLSRWDLLGKVEQNVTDTAQLNALIDTLPSNPDFSYVRVARTDAGWNPQAHTWDGTHPNSTGEVVIAGAFADALAGLGIGSAYGARTAVQWPVSTVITTAASTAPAPAAGGSVSAIAGDNEATLSWTASSGASGYLIQQRQNGGAADQLAWPVSDTKFTPGILAGDSLYDFRVVPVSDNGQIHLAWNAAPGANAYAIRSRDLTTGSGWTTLPLPVQATSYDLAGIPDHVYSFAIQPGKGVMTGAWSPEASQLIRRTGTPSAWSAQVRVKDYHGKRKTARDFAIAWAGALDFTWEDRYGSAGDDCTHFVSQTLLTAGYPEMGEPSRFIDALYESAVNDDGAWWRVDEGSPIRAGLLIGGYVERNASATFTLAPRLANHFALRSRYGLAQKVSDPRLLDYGDVILMQTFNHGPDIDHAVIVTGFDSTGYPLISERSNAHVNKSLREIENGNSRLILHNWHLLQLN
ncbi:hypothetical protein GCM10010168_51430 [Actinoplanes ianthinogenes]|uniref:Fibronectin type-III domain-containing protein n=1 Tax=Actinoplanes ianthinogenes TaxID=122358 RepID=A0ABM7M3H7_9ACTN|nr:GDSL-type esterase/lipase family protein [Actinoplanes ianthinogenes]BCJ46194.1 hypothetical protein Aiant_68510 [Actinoplanes ianthinogenes]GGR26954.1 hypothetical protein GCM10010168_51430 [Actinoplanes ianthinogenes]